MRSELTLDSAFLLDWRKKKNSKVAQLLLARFRDCLFPLADAFPLFMSSPLVIKMHCSLSFAKVYIPRQLLVREGFA